MIKRLLKMIHYFLIHPVDRYVINEVVYEELKYSEYHLFQINKIFMLIPVHIHLITVNSLGLGKEKAQLWYYNYNNRCTWHTYYHK